MNNQITVRSVIERNDCSSRKYIDVTSLEDDELIASRFRLTKAYMFPHEKLLLSTVAPMDHVIVAIDEHPSNPIIVGEYVQNISSISDRVPVCRCGTYLVSDGFDIYCPNQQCGLTLLSRLERLAKTPFFGYDTEITDMDCNGGLMFGDDPTLANPFSIIIDPKLWGHSIHDMETILLKYKPGDISIATFLIEPLFREFLDCVNPNIDFDSQRFSLLTNFYWSISAVTQRRNPEDTFQNKFIKELIWSLGLESLTIDVIDKMAIYEKTMGWESDILVPYAYLLTKPHELVTEIGVHPLEAQEICTEFRRRKYEFFDVFAHYSSPEAIKDIFTNTV